MSHGGAGHPSAFAGLLGTMSSADAAAGGPVMTGDRSSKAEEEKQMLQVPPQPSPPVRMPRKTRHLLDMPSSGGSWGSSSACSSETSSRASLLGFGPLPDDVGQSGYPGRSQPVTAKGTSDATDLRDSFCQHPASSAEAAVEETGMEKCGGAAARGAAPFSYLFAGSHGTPRTNTGDSWSAGAGTEASDRNEHKTLDEYTGICCFRRDGRKPRRFGGGVSQNTSASSHCAAIREDRPETTFSRDVTLLELRSLLRSHSVEPSDALVADLLRWQVVTSRGALTAGVPPASSGGNGTPTGQ
mmetsp:Transcript_57582/g.166665  ORF Transcript_57582/g.166665 Transcript_57582/m.166665 type:complete len:299 (-) Transcript_57582:135-1031(-)|eukprot:CAMPEP_0170206706 /NCGR_PEP_ID=MMETSP0116_2-20130129/2919_1 /TAXON_ID=400756 /ORGANISM="Durinskia baltica, Strain CSIRO CS-38" /LENGTH=298 /DNA_ID=CAMNT_0010457141 /DNA_START=118 /DNA_END=1014 /DNA_ORIENTATION=-